MMMSPITAPIDAALLDRVDALQSTADYIRCLLEIIGTATAQMRNALAKGQLSGTYLAECGDWQQIQTLICLAQTQADIVTEVGRAAEAAQMAL